MQWDFADRHLQELYEKGRSKKFKFVDKALARKFVERIGSIEATASIMSNYKPFINLGPGDTIKEELAHYGWNQKDLAESRCKPPSAVAGISQG